MAVGKGKNVGGCITPDVQFFVCCLVCSWMSFNCSHRTSRAGAYCRLRSEAPSSATHLARGRGGTSSVGTATPVIGIMADIGLGT